MLMIDCGAYVGKMIDTYHQSGWIDDTWDIYAFEPMPKLYKQTKENLKQTGLKVKVLRKACWIKNGTVWLNTREREDASYILEAREDIHKDDIRVPCIDFSQFVSTLPQVDVCSMDIEGAEYQVLQKMIDDGTIKKIKFLDIEFHYRLMPNVSQEFTIDFIKKLNDLGVRVRLKDRLR